jgi:nucleoside-diphosphate-sugar epimerase
MSRVLVLGGSGFIGRNVVRYLVENNLASKIKVADKKYPEMVGMSKPFTAAFENDKVEFVQANLLNAEAIADVFKDASGDYDIVINAAAETRLSLEPGAYKEGIVILSTLCAKEAVRHNAKRFIQLSTAQVYESSSKQKDEQGKVDPWTNLAKASLEAEQELKKIEGLNLVIVRPAIVYGPSDTGGLGPRIAVAAIYKKLGKPMKLLWGGSLKINTVHVNDVVRAIWFLVSHGEQGQVYNLADKTDTDQEKLNTILEKVFGIKTGYKSKVTAQIAAKVSMSFLTEEVNSRHIDPWAQLLKDTGLQYSKLTPYLDEELLYNNDMAVNGCAIEKHGFHYEHPLVTEKEIRDVIDEYILAEWFPKNFL